MYSTLTPLDPSHGRSMGMKCVSRMAPLPSSPSINRELYALSRYHDTSPDPAIQKSSKEDRSGIGARIASFPSILPFTQLEANLPHSYPLKLNLN